MIVSSVTCPSTNVTSRFTLRACTEAVPGIEAQSSYVPAGMLSIKKCPRSLLKIFDRVQNNMLLDDWTSVGVSYAAGDNTTTNQCEIDILNVFIFTNQNGLRMGIFLSRHVGRH